MKIRFVLFSLIVAAGASLNPIIAQQYDPPSDDKAFERQYQERIKKDRLHGIYIPKNMDDALAQLDKLTSPESKLKFKSIPEDSVIQVMHNRLGQWMIVNWSFYEGSRLSHYLRSAGVTYPDDMADFLILAFHRRLNDRPVVIKELAIYFREKRKAAWKEEIKDGEVLKEETRQRPRPDSASPKPAKPAQNPSPKAAPSDVLTPKGGTEKQ